MADYSTSNSAVTAASGSTTSAKITAAIGRAPVSGDRVAIDGNLNDVYVGAWLFVLGSWTRLGFGAVINPVISLESTYAKQLLVRRAQYGEGYVRLTPIGANSQIEEWAIKTVPVNQSVRNLIECAALGLFAQGQTGVFTWTPPGTQTQKRWVVKDGNWNVQTLANQKYIVTVNIKQTYNPA